jgi:nucleoside-diphosphate-sugar epimerase
LAARVVVTGAQGLLGRHLAAALLDDGADAVLGLGRSERRGDRYTYDLAWLGSRVPAPLPASLEDREADPRYDYASLDLRDGEAVGNALRAFRPQVVIHAAAALRDAPWDKLIASNLQATVGLAQALTAVTDGPTRLVLVSSGSVYGAGGGKIPLVEDGPVEPLDPYGATKRAAEDAARVTLAGTDVELVVARVFNLVGAGLQDRHLPGKLAGEINAIARGLSSPDLHLGPLESTRDFIDVRDAASAVLALASAPDPPPVANVASGVEVGVQTILDQFLELAGTPDVHVHRTEGRRADAPRLYADVSRLTALGFAPRHELREALGDMLRYFDAFPER